MLSAIRATYANHISSETQASINVVMKDDSGVKISCKKQSDPIYKH